MFNWRQVWELCTLWGWESHDSATLQVILNNMCTMGSYIVVFKDECIPILTGIGHNNELNDFVSVVEPSDIPLALADTEFCLPSHGDIPPPHHQTMTLLPL